MFGTGFTLSGLTISALTQQVLGLLDNAFITGALLAVMALPFARKIARTLKSIVGGR
jgi:hypothetical protein